MNVVANLDFESNFGEEYAKNLPTLAEEIGRVLKFFAINHGYGIGGDYAANLIRGIEDQIDLYPSSNEMHAGFTACGDAEINGASLCFITYTVGSMPVVSAAALAKAEKLPVIFISGSPGESEVRNREPLHHVVHPSDSWSTEYNAAINVFSALEIRSERLQGMRTPGQPSVASQRFFFLVKEAIEKKEPVFIEIPRDIVFQKVQPITLLEKPSEFSSSKSMNLAGVSEIARHIVKKLSLAKRPVLFFGERLKLNTELINLVKELSLKTNMPYASNLFAKGILDEFSPLSLGVYNGVFSSDFTRNIIDKKADYILEISTSIQIHDTSSAFATGTYKIPEISNKTMLKGSFPDTSDVLAVMKELFLYDLPVFEDFINKSNDSTALDPLANLNFRNLKDVLNNIQNETKQAFVYLPEIGNSFFASFALKTRKSELGRSWLTNPWYAAMGTSLPYARAVCDSIKKHSYSDIPIVITGDGGFHFQLNDIIHLQKNEHFVIIIVLRNNVFGLGKVSDAKVYYCDDTNFDMKYLAMAYNANYALAKTVSEFENAIKGPIQSKKGIHIIEVPLGNTEEEQSSEIALLNTYIKAKSGVTDDVIKWDKICNGS